MKILSIFLFSFYLCAHADLVREGDSGIFGPKWNDLLGEMQNWQKSYSDLVEVIDYGITNEKRTMRLVLIMDRKATAARRAFIMTGTIHGNEYLNLEDRIPLELLKRAGGAGPVNVFLKQGGVFIFIPIINPDGYEKRQRGNANGTDLNRDWNVPSAGFKGFKEVESRDLAKIVENLRVKYQFKVVVNIDYHCCAGANLHPWGYKREKIPEMDVKRHLVMADIATSLIGSKSGTPLSILGYTAMGTTLDYYYETYGSTSLTYEGRYKEEHKYFDKHVAWFEGMLKTLTTNGTDPRFYLGNQFYWFE